MNRHIACGAALLASLSLSLSACAAPDSLEITNEDAPTSRQQALSEAPIILAFEGSSGVSLSAPVRAGSPAEIRFEQRTLYWFQCAPRYYLPNGFRVDAKVRLNGGAVQTVALESGSLGFRGSFVPSEPGELELWFEERNDYDCFRAYPGADDPMSLTVVAPAEPDIRRTVVYIFGETQPGQDMFIRGGIDHGAAQARFGYDCARSPHLCSLPIAHRSDLNATTQGWKIGDNHLDWYGAELVQGSALDGTRPQGSPLDWTTNEWPASWGPVATIDEDGYGLDAMNEFGMHYWKLDVDMDCSRAVPDAAGNLWFELKSFISNGPGWEGNVRQSGAPYLSNNHFAQCGKVNIFRRGQDQALIRSFPQYEAGTSLSCAGGALIIEPAEYGQYVARVTDDEAVAYFLAKSEETFEHTYDLYGNSYTRTVTRELPWQVVVADDEQSMTVSDFRRYSDGSFLTSGPPGTSLEWNGNTLTLSVRTAKALGSHVMVYYDVGTYTFADCQAL